MDSAAGNEVRCRTSGETVNRWESMSSADADQIPPRETNEGEYEQGGKKAMEKTACAERYLMSNFLRVELASASDDKRQK